MTVQPPEPLLAALRAGTAEQHQALEARLDLLSPNSDLAGYKRLLGRFYGFYAPLEDRLAAVAAWETLAYDFDHRRKTPLLARDLAALGIEAAALPRCHDLPPCDGLAAGLGCMYVIEGSTLGGQLMTRHFGALLGLDAASGLAYFGSYGAEVGSQWVAFRAFLARQAADPAMLEQATQAANETFDALGRWLA